MPFSLEQRGFDDQGLRLRRIADGLDHPDALLSRLAVGLAQMWRDNIEAGPNERWEAGPSYRVQALGGTTLRDRGLMWDSIVGRQTGPYEVTIGSDLSVGGGWNLLAIHEFGADVKAKSAQWLVFRYPLGASTLSNTPGKPLTQSAAESGWARKKEIHIPRRPSAPFDWDRGELTPEADQLVRSCISDCLVEVNQ
jgi:hypothetical protein